MLSILVSLNRALQKKKNIAISFHTTVLQIVSIRQIVTNPTLHNIHIDIFHHLSLTENPCHTNSTQGTTTHSSSPYSLTGPS